MIQPSVLRRDLETFLGIAIALTVFGLFVFSVSDPLAVAAHQPSSTLFSYCVLHILHGAVGFFFFYVGKSAFWQRYAGLFFVLGLLGLVYQILVVPGEPVFFGVAIRFYDTLLLVVCLYTGRFLAKRRHGAPVGEYVPLVGSVGLLGMLCMWAGAVGWAALTCGVVLAVWFVSGLWQKHLAVMASVLMAAWVVWEWKKVHTVPSEALFNLITAHAGWFGCLLLFFVYSVLIAIGLRIAVRLQDPFAVYTSLACVACIMLEVSWHILAALGLISFSGLPLPFISVDGSSLFALGGMLGLMAVFVDEDSVFTSSKTT